MTGSIYTVDGVNYSERLYHAYPELETVNILAGLALLGAAGLAIYVRNRLAGYFEDGPQKLNMLYIYNIVVTAVYLFATISVLPDGVSESVDFSSYYVSVAISIAMVCANTTYFKKREDMFVN